MYSGITKIYYSETVGQVFTKPVQIEGTTENFVPSTLFFIILVVHISAARRCKCM
jgi:cytochrome bd-type quinol oxidase subunit 1